MMGACVRASEEAGQAVGQLELQGPRPKAQQAGAAAIWGSDARGGWELVPMLLSDGVGDAEPAMLG